MADAASPPGPAAFDMEFAALSGSRLLPVGDEAAGALVEEATLVGPRLAAMREVLVVAQRPG